MVGRERITWTRACACVRVCTQSLGLTADAPPHSPLLFLGTAQLTSLKPQGREGKLLLPHAAGRLLPFPSRLISPIVVCPLGIFIPPAGDLIRFYRTGRLFGTQLRTFRCRAHVLLIPTASFRIQTLVCVLAGEARAVQLRPVIISFADLLSRGMGPNMQLTEAEKRIARAGQKRARELRHDYLLPIVPRLNSLDVCKFLHSRVTC